MPVPFRFETCGLPTALSDTCNVPVLVPVWVGVNATLMVQLALEVKFAWHVVEETLKSPVVEMETFLSITFWLFLRVNVFAALFVPTLVGEYVALAGVNVAWALPVPDSDTVCGLFVALSVIESVPVRDPVWVGLKVTLIAQLLPAARVLPQLFVCEKSPLVAMLLMSSVALPPLVSVAVFAALFASTMTVPNERALGDTLMPVTCGSTVRLTEVEPVKLPDMPEMVIALVPKVAEPLAVKVNVLVVAAGFGLNPAVTPLGSPEADSVTLPLNPPPSVIVMVVVAVLP